MLTDTATLESRTAETRVDLHGSRRPRRVLVVTGPFPCAADPTYGVFVKERAAAVAELPDNELRVIAPVPYFPPIRLVPKWHRWSQFPRHDEIGKLKIERPRYFLPPKIGGYFHPQLMWRCVKREADRLRASGWDFDLIDAHFIYPNGVVGAMLARAFNKPLVVTGRGEDILRFPSLPVIGEAIRRAVPHINRFVALSDEIGQAFIKAGADPGRVHQISNGVDCSVFQPLDRDECRRKLGIDTTGPVIVSVGNRQERKGFHLLVEALPEVLQRFPKARLYIVGGPAPYGSDHTAEIESRIQALQLENRVQLVGSVPHQDLAEWYSAADVFALLSSREGSPNVVMESLACGVPVVATNVGNVRDILSDPVRGVVIPERSAAAAARGLIEVLSGSASREAIRRSMEKSTWSATALAVNDVFELAYGEGPPAGR